MSSVSKFDVVHASFGHLKYMRRSHALYMRELITTYDIEYVLELGTYHGKGTAYLAAILEDLGRGRVTTLDRCDCLRHSPNVHEVLAEVRLEHRVDVRLHPRSFTMTLMQMLEAHPRPTFDLCYLDGAHTWDGTGFAFFLIDKLLTPGGWLVMDDLDWTIAGSPSYRAAEASGLTHPWTQYSVEEKEMRQVRKVWDLLVGEAGYTRHEEKHLGWGIARKPLR